MQKLTRIFAIVAAALIIISLLLILISIPLQRPIGRLMSYPEEMMSFLPKVPFVPILFCLVRLVCVAPLVITDGKKGSIVPEILALLGMILLIPLLSTVVNLITPMIQSAFALRSGSMQVVANSLMNMITSYCTVPAGLGQSVAYVVCGMRIATKWMNKKES